MGKAKECAKLQQENKMVESAVQSVTQRADVISFGTLAEINYFQKSRVEDFKSTMTTYLEEQIKFYKEVSWVGSWDYTWVKVFRINPEFRILRLTFHSRPQNAEFSRLLKHLTCLFSFSEVNWSIKLIF